MLAIALFLAQNAFGIKIAEYRFGMNFGQLYLDYSGKDNNAVNGDSYSSMTNDAWPTDRGAYFEDYSRICLPANDKVTTGMTLSSTFSILGWFMPDNYDGIFFERKSTSSSYFYVETFDSGKGLSFSGNIGGTAYSKSTTSYLAVKSKVYIDEWNLISLIVSGTSLIVYSKTNAAISLTLQSAYSESQSFNFAIGSRGGYSNGSLRGFCWYFVVADSVLTPSSFMSTSSCTSCLSPTCTKSVSPSIVDPYAGTGCVSMVSGKNKNSWDNSCPSSSYFGCSGSTLLNCLCSFGSCVLSGNTPVCNCASGLIATSTNCISCLSDCQTCITNNVCSSCIASNASPSGSGCACNSGFYNITSLTSSSSCLSCNPNCLTCSTSNLCISCKDTNAIPSMSIGCECKSSYYNSTSLNANGACLACNADCKTCSSSINCLSCKDSNSVPSTYGCICLSNFFNQTSLKSGGICEACMSECATCSSALTCLTCIDSNALIHDIGCICKNGYFNTSDIIVDGRCIRCNLNCLTCSNLNTCTSCIDSNAKPNGNAGCICLDGYFNSTEINYNGNCLPCNSDCETCESASICLTCKSVNSEPTLSGGCKCKTGYYNTTSLTSSNSCIQVSLASIEIYSNSSKPNSYFNYLVTVKLFDQTNTPLNSPESITISSNTSDLFSTQALIQSICTVECTFLVYSKISGPLLITASSYSLSSSLEVTILKLKTKFSEINPIVISN